MNLFKKIIYEIINFFKKIIYGVLHFSKKKPFSMEKNLKEKDYFLYTYKFPDNTIFVGQAYSLNFLDFLHHTFGRGYFEPISVARRKYPYVCPEVLLNLKSPRTLEELNIARRKVLGLYPNMRVLNQHVDFEA